MVKACEHRVLALHKVRISGTEVRDAMGVLGTPGLLSRATVPQVLPSPQPVGGGELAIRSLVLLACALRHLHRCSVKLPPAHMHWQRGSSVVLQLMQSRCGGM